MNIKDLDLPVPYHETFDVHDTTKISKFMDCPRGYFFEYIMGYRPDEPNIHLVFGKAWHEGMEILMNDGLGDDALLKAAQAFQETYHKEIPPDALDVDRMQKTVDNGIRALASYCKTYRSIDNFETLYTEVSGVAPLSLSMVIHFKVDTIIKDQVGIWSLEHKTTGRNTQANREKWQIMPQPGTYTHALKCAFDPGLVQGTKINMAVIRSKDEEFMRLPVRLSNPQLQLWLWEMQHWVQQLRWNFEQLVKTTPDQPVMQAFPRNPVSCSKFGCSYPGLCEMWCNPVAKQGEVPLGYKVERWDPREREKDSKHKLSIDETGKGVITDNEPTA